MKAAVPASLQIILGWHVDRILKAITERRDTVLFLNREVEGLLAAAWGVLRSAKEFLAQYRIQEGTRFSQARAKFEPPTAPENEEDYVWNTNWYMQVFGEVCTTLYDEGVLARRGRVVDASNYLYGDEEAEGEAATG